MMVASDPILGVAVHEAFYAGKFDAINRTHDSFYVSHWAYRFGFEWGCILQRLGIDW